VQFFSPNYSRDPDAYYDTFARVTAEIAFTVQAVVPSLGRFRDNALDERIQ